nr:hypothetical protein BaRGS_004287 [Batillaria attramentaria]
MTEPPPQEPFPDDVAADIAKAEKQNVDVLEAALLDLGLPPTIDRTDKPRRHVADDVTVVMVSDEGEALGVFFEDVTMETLFVHKAITADAGGQTFLDVFRPPRRVTYIMNHVIGLTNTPVQTAGVKLTAVVRLPSKDVSCEDIEKIVREFLDSKQMRMFEKVSYEAIVVKAYGLNWYGSKGVSFHPISDVNAIVTAVLDLLNRIIPGQGILVQSFITTFDRAMTSGTGPFYCQRGGDINSPVNGDNTIPMSLELMLRKWGIRDVTQQKQVHDVIKQKSERLLLELLEREKRLTVVEKGGAGAELAMIGLDVVLAKVNDVITPVVIEVNGECCIEQAFVYETTVPVLQGESEYLWVQTMVSRSQRFLMQDKTVVVVGGIRHVTTYNEAAEHVERIPKTLRTVDGLGYGESMLLMPLLVGTEHSVEVVLFEESQRQLITAAVTCCKTLGLLTGVFDVDMMLTTVGPKLLEVNARMGGLYTRDFIRTIYDVDLLHLSLMATCGMRPVASNSLVGGYSTSSTRDNSGQLIGLLLYPGRHGNALATTATPARLRSLHDQGVIKFLQFEETPDDCFSEYEEPFAAVGVHGATLEEARSKFKGTCLALGLETEASVGELLQHVCDCEN